MSSTPLEALLPSFNFSGFPVDACSKVVDETLHESERLFCVVLYNPKWNLAEIRLLRPYLHFTLPEHRRDTPLPVYYGWASLNGQDVFDHHENCIHLDDARVVAWREADFKTLHHTEWKEN